MPRTCLKKQPLTSPSATTLFLCYILPSPFSNPAQSAGTKTAFVSHCSDHTRSGNFFMYPEICASGSLSPCVFCKQFHSTVVPGPQGTSSAPETFLTLAFVSLCTVCQACSCHISCPHPSHSLPGYVATLPPVPSLSLVKEASYTALATGSLKKVSSQRPGTSWDLPGAWQDWQKNSDMYFFQISTHSLCTHQCTVSLTSHLKVVREQPLSAFLPFCAPDCSAYKLAGTGVVSHHFLAQTLAQRDSDLHRSKPCCTNS